MSPLLINFLFLINFITLVTCANSNQVNYQDKINHELLTHSRPDPINETIVIESWKSFSAKLDKFITSKVSRVETYYQQLISDDNQYPKLNISSECQESINFFFEEAKQSKGWAVKSKSLINSQIHGN